MILQREKYSRHYHSCLELVQFSLCKFLSTNLYHSEEERENILEGICILQVFSLYGKSYTHHVWDVNDISFFKVQFIWLKTNKKKQKKEE